MSDLWADHLGTSNEELIAYVRGLQGSCRLGILSNSSQAAGMQGHLFENNAHTLTRIAAHLDAGPRTEGRLPL